MFKGLDRFGRTLQGVGHASTGQLFSRRFLPLLAAQTLTAFNDGLFKNAAAILALFTGLAYGPVFVALGGAVFILPYVFCSSFAGEIADRFEKSRLITITKWLELLLMVAAMAALTRRDLAMQLSVLFGLGVQASLFSPVKYAILPDHLAERQLVTGNGLIEAGTFIGVLGGTVAGAALILAPWGDWIVGSMGILAAIAGLVLSFLIPMAPPAAPELPISWNIVAATNTILRQACATRAIRLSILGLSWVWAIGGVVLTELTVVAQEATNTSGRLATLLLTVFSVGIGTGAVLCGRLLKGEVSPRHVPFAACGISLFAWDFVSVWQDPVIARSFSQLGGSVASFPGWRMLADLFLLGACGGIFSVPLNAIIQARADPAARSRTIAANNILNAALMALAGLVAAVLSLLGVSALRILWLTALANAVVAVWIFRILPQETLRAIARWYFRVFHRAELIGLENYAAAGKRTVIVVNHLSLLDGALLAGLLPDAPAFAIYAAWVHKWWMRPFLIPFTVLPVDPNNPYSVRDMVRWVQQDRKLVIFPEGRITRTGALMKVYDGAALVADRAGADIVPIHIDGLQFSPFSRMRGKQRLRWFPPVRMTILPRRSVGVEAGIFGRERRRRLGAQLHDVMVNATFAARRPEGSLFAALLDARDRYGAGTELVEDVARVPLTYGRLVSGAAVLGRALHKAVPAGERVGLMLPNASAALVTFFGLQAFGRVPALLNYSAGPDIMLSACRTAQITCVVSSRGFVSRARLENAVAKLASEIQFFWLEELQPEIGVISRMRGFVDSWLARHLPGSRVAADNPAVVLFTSGTEGLPKGVVLSHRNILANCAQIAAVIDFNPSDRALNALPMFHSFGLTVATVLPAISGVRSFLYPSPLHYRIVPDAIYDSDATIMFGTDTFLNGWARSAHPYDFHAVRYVFAGAEKLREETRQLYLNRFGLRIYEGYGITETGPVLAANTPMHFRAGSVGRLLPGIEGKLEKPAGDIEGGRLHVRGPNVMLGYLRPGGSGTPEPLLDGWFDTGDIVTIDADGFVTIRGRAKRFAKIGGEMVSMMAAEELASACWPTASHAVVSEPDALKGERLVLLTTEATATAQTLLAHARGRGIAEIMVPRAVRVVLRIPLLGSGKIDYGAASRLLHEAPVASLGA